MQKPNASKSNTRVPYDSLTLRAVVEELHQLLAGGQVQEIRQPSPSEVQISVRSQGKTYWLLASVEARYARLHILSQRSPNAPTPPNFCMVLRRYLENDTIQYIQQVGFDRVVEIEVLTRDKEGEPTTVTLVGEFMGKHSNLILVRENGKIIDAMKRISHRINRYREILPGVEYLPPPKQMNPFNPLRPQDRDAFLSEFSALETAAPEQIAESLQKRFMGLSPFLAQEIALRVVQGEESREENFRREWEAIFDSGKESPVLIQPPAKQPYAYPIPLISFPDDYQKPARSLNLALDFAYSITVGETAFQEEANTLRGQILHALQRHEHQLEIATHLAEEAERAEKYNQVGELIMANLWQITLGTTQITVQDYFDPNYAERVIKLDSKLSAQENAGEWFEKARKARGGAEVAKEQGARAKEPIKRLQEALAQVEAWEEAEEHDTDALKALHKKLRSEQLLPDEMLIEAQTRKNASEFQGHKIRRVKTPQGYEVLIGETATANDFLLTRIASPNDLWFHVRASTSAHVIVRTHNRPDAVPRTVIEAAALLCARHSSEKHASIVPVDYTLRKYVRKPRGSAPGTAHYERESTLHITP